MNELNPFNELGMFIEKEALRANIRHVFEVIHTYNPKNDFFTFVFKLILEKDGFDKKEVLITIVMKRITNDVKTSEEKYSELKRFFLNELAKFGYTNKNMRTLI